MDTEDLPDNLPGKKRRRSLRPLLALLIAILLSGLSGLMWMRKMQERREFVGKVDPKSGYRYRFTVGSGWEQGSPGLGSARSHVEMVQLKPPPPNPIRQWIEDHLFHRSPPNPRASGIMIYTLPDQSLNDLPIRNGYPDLSTWGMPFSEHHLKIDGCPATVGTVSFYMTVLLIYTPDRKLAYDATAVASMKDDPTDREMQAIIRSFRIEKVGKVADKQ